jgi:hypothetical protein
VEKDPAAAPPDLASPLVGAGEAALALGRLAEAEAPLSRAVRLLEGGEGDQPLLARARYGLARALATDGGDLSLVRKLLHEANLGFSRSDPRRASEVEAWEAKALSRR